MKPSHILSVIIATSTVTTAWPWPPSLQDIRSLAGLDKVLGRRQNDGGNNENTGNNNNNGNDDASQATPAPTRSATVRQTDSPTTGSKAVSATNSRDRTTEPATVPTDAFPGGVNIITPNTLFGGSQYYAISSGVESTVTWVWNYTSLIRTPAHIDVVATMLSTAGGVNPSPFTLSGNMSFEKTQTFKWDTGEYASTSAMPSGIYTLNIYDADLAGGATAIASAGRLSPFNAWQFGVYSPAPYYVLQPAIQCATCNAAGGKMERLAWGTLVGSLAVVMGTMMWFTGVAGLW